MTTHPTAAAAEGLPRFTPVKFTGNAEYRLSTATGWLEVWCQTDAFTADHNGPWVAVYSSEADALAGADPLIRMSRAWFDEVAMERLGEHEGALS